MMIQCDMPSCILVYEQYLLISMESLQKTQCQVCLNIPPVDNKITMKCNHAFCTNCLREYIRVLKLYRQLKPEKLQCIHEGCNQQIDDAIILKVFPGQQGYVLKTIRKCYKQSKNPSVMIFCCTGLMKSNRKTLIEKGNEKSREQLSRLTNNLVRDIKAGKISIEDTKICNNIHMYNRGVANKDKCLQCYQCGCSFCVLCFQLMHEGPCPIVQTNSMLQLKKTSTNNNFEDFITANQIRRCLNEKCGVPIAKEEGCYWVKCRCTWQMCYPCGKLWGNCEHFSKYPYQKFVPPSDWLVKALNLF